MYNGAANYALCNFLIACSFELHSLLTSTITFTFMYAIAAQNGDNSTNSMLKSIYDD